MTAVVGLSMATHTPVPYWLDQPVADLVTWIEATNAELKRQTPRS